MNHWILFVLCIKNDKGMCEEFEVIFYEVRHVNLKVKLAKEK